MTTVTWVSGASSGIGRAVIENIPYPRAHTIGVSRRPSNSDEDLTADLSDPAEWKFLTESFANRLSDPGVERAVFFHAAATNDAVGPVAETDADQYERAVLLNAAAGPVLARAFLAAAARSNAQATLVLCSSPAGQTPMIGLSHYCAGKAGLDQWAATAALEQQGVKRPVTIFSVMPFAVDTPLLHDMRVQQPDTLPLSAFFEKAAADGLLASTEETAAQIWAAIENPPEPGSVVPVGNPEIVDQVQVEF